MAYNVKVTGKASFKTAELLCETCFYEEDRTVDLRGCDTQDQQDQAMNEEIKCPNCEGSYMVRVWRTAPSVGQYNNPTSDKSIAARQQYFRSMQRKGVTNKVESDDDVRHRKGVNYDDALRSGEAQRIKKDLE